MPFLPPNQQRQSTEGNVFGVRYVLDTGYKFRAPDETLFFGVIAVGTLVITITILGKLP